MTRAAAMVLGLIAATLPSLPGHAKRAPIPAASLPAWVREAATRSVAGTASWAILHEEIEVEPLLEGGVRITTRFAARIVSAEALDLFRAFNVVRGADDEVLVAQGWNLLPDGMAVLPDPKDDVSDIPWRDGWEIDDVRSRHVQLPGVVRGSVVAWEHVVRRGTDTGAQLMIFGTMDVPTALSRAILRVPPGWTLETVVRNGAPDPTRGEDSVTLEMEDLRALAPDPIPPAAVEALPTAWLRWFSPDGTRGHRDWASVGRWYGDLSRGVAAQAGTVEPLSKSLAPASPADLRAAVERAFAFVSRDVRYVAIEIGIGGFKPASPDATCKDKYGDCKAKSFLMRSIVKPWGLTAWPVLVRTRDIGAVDPDVPTPQFNHCIVGLELPEGLPADGWAVVDVPRVGRMAFLDPTITMSGSAPLRSDDQGTLALLVRDTETQLVRLPVQQPEAGGKRAKLDVRIDESGVVLEGRLITTWTGDWASMRRTRFMSLAAGDRIVNARDRLQEMASGATLKEHAIAALDDVSVPLVETITFAGGHVGRRAMDLLVVQAGAFAPEVLGDRPAPPPRPWPLDVDAPRLLEAIVTIHPPPGWQVEKPAKPWTMDTPWLTGASSWDVAADGTLTWHRIARVLVATVEPADYTAFHRALGELRSRDDEGLTLVSSAAP